MYGLPTQTEQIKATLCFKAVVVKGNVDLETLPFVF